MRASAGVDRELSHCFNLPMWIIYLGAAATILAIVLLAVWRSRSTPASRRSRELRAGPRRFHWGLIAAYMGDADPTKLATETAADILQNGWSCPDLEAVRRKMRIYVSGEVNHAFDAVRIMWLSELCVAAGWMTEAELEQWSTPQRQRAVTNYRSWQEYETEVVQGRQRWWSEVARKAMPGSQAERAVEIRGEAKAVFGNIPWAA